MENLHGTSVNKIDASAAIFIDSDKMKAYITISPPDGGKMLSFDESTSILAQRGVVHGIDYSTLENIAKYPVYNEKICIAKGDTPVNGQNGKVQYHFNIERDHKPTILDDGRVDFRELNLIESVLKGQKLCSAIDPIPGKPGKNVSGIEVSAKDGKPAVLPKGRNTELSEDGKSLLSSIDGQVVLIDDKVNVFSIYEVPADIDNSTGNIYFVGNVIVRGNVLSGFTVEAGGNVEVWGVVEGAVIKAGGDIILRRGMQGLGKGVLVSDGDIIARYIENSNIEAKNSIKAEAIMHSNIRCGNKLELSGRKGLLVGGTCKVANEITAKVIGSHMATGTDIEVGIDPTVRERFKAVKSEIEKMEVDYTKADQAITLLKKLETAGMLTPEKRELLVKSVRTKIHLSSRINELKEEMIELDAKLQQESVGKIRVENFIYPGTKVTIGSCFMNIRDNLQFCTLYRDGADIRMTSYDAK